MSEEQLLKIMFDEAIYVNNYGLAIQIYMKMCDCDYAKAKMKIKQFVDDKQARSEALEREFKRCYGDSE